MRVYIASPMFNEYQEKVVHQVEDILDNLGIDNYSPFRDGITLSSDASREEKSQVFRDNVDNIKSCDTMIAIIDDRDTGTTFEQGVFYAQWRNSQDNIRANGYFTSQTHPRLISYLSKPKSNISVMLTEASMMLCIGADELYDYLVECLSKGIHNMVRDDRSFDRVFTH